MKVNKIAHIGIAVKQISDWSNLYSKILKLENRGIETLKSRNVKVAFFQIGESAIELVEPLNDDSPIAKYIAKNGEGLHHIAIEVEDIQEAIDQCKKHGMQLIDQEPRDGAHGTRIAFIHPKSTGGILLELCQITDSMSK